MKGRDRCTLLMHTDDARRRGVVTGDLVEVVSPTGRLQVPVEVIDAIKPVVVSMPHGWGHVKPGTRMSVANGSPGVNTNVLSPPTFLDEPSGNGALNGIPITVIRRDTKPLRRHAARVPRQLEFREDAPRDDAPREDTPQRPDPLRLDADRPRCPQPAARGGAQLHTRRLGGNDGVELAQRTPVAAPVVGQV